MELQQVSEQIKGNLGAPAYKGESGRHKPVKQGVRNDEGRKGPVQECEGGTLRFAARESDPFPEAPATGVGRFKEPADDGRRKDGQYGRTEGQFGNVLDTNVECHGVAYGSQDGVGVGDKEESAGANPDGGTRRCNK